MRSPRIVQLLLGAGEVPAVVALDEDGCAWLLEGAQQLGGGMAYQWRPLPLPPQPQRKVGPS